MREKVNKIPIMYQLEDSIFHKILVDSMLNKKTVSSIIKGLDHIKPEVHWDTWDVTLEDIDVWIQAYTYNKQPEWREWLFSKWLQELMSKSNLPINLNSVIENKKIFVLFRTEALKLNWPSELENIKSYVYDNKKKVSLHENVAKDQWAWFYLHDKCNNIKDYLTYPLYDLDDNMTCNILHRLPPPQTYKDECLYIKLLTSYCDNMSSELESSHISEFKQKGIPDDMIARLYISYLLSSQHDLTIQHIPSDLLEPIYKNIESKRGWYVKILRSQDKETMINMADKLDIDEITNKTNKNLYNDICMVLFKHVIDYYKKNPLLEHLINMHEPENWMSVYDNLKQESLNITDTTNILPVIV